MLASRTELEMADCNCACWTAVCNWTCCTLVSCVVGLFWTAFGFTIPTGPELAKLFVALNCVGVGNCPPLPLTEVVLLLGGQQAAVVGNLLDT